MLLLASLWLWFVSFASVCFGLVCLVSLLDGSRHPSFTSAYVLLFGRWCDTDGQACVLSGAVVK